MMSVSKFKKVSVNKPLLNQNCSQCLNSGQKDGLGKVYCHEFKTPVSSTRARTCPEFLNKKKKGKRLKKGGKFIDEYK